MRRVLLITNHPNVNNAIIQVLDKSFCNIYEYSLIHMKDEDSSDDSNEHANPEMAQIHVSNEVSIYSQKTHLDSQAKSVHLKIKDFQCSECGQVFLILLRHETANTLTLHGLDCLTSCKWLKIELFCLSCR